MPRTVYFGWICIVFSNHFVTYHVNISVSDWPSNQLTKTEALSGSQHVVLWLTRTSMSTIPSVPSLKNLVQSSLFGPGNSADSNRSNSHRNSQSSHNMKPHKGSGVHSASAFSNNPIQRNFSTKSFLKLRKDEDTEDLPIRKCNTALALSGMSSSSSNAGSSSKPHKSTGKKWDITEGLRNV